MLSSSNSKIGFALIIATLLVATPLALFSFMNQTPPQTEGEGENITNEETDSPEEEEYEPPVLQTPVESINITLFTHSGTLIEANNIRIYVDPYELNETYSEYPADLILITHSHYDHYSPDDIQLIITNDTFVVLPQYLAPNLALYDNGMVANPGDSFDFGGINITVFYMYYQGSANHPKSANSNSYFIEIDGFTIFHGGCAKYMPELENITMDIDVALLGIVYDMDVGSRETNFLSTLQVIELLEPEYCIPTHWIEEIDREIFHDDYVPLIDDDCIVLNLDFFSWHVFSND